MTVLTCAFVACWAVPAAPPREPAMQKALALPPRSGNPRNSEGDFVQLKDGRILFVYTHFTGGGADDSRAHLAGRVSADGGRTWSAEDRVVVRNEGTRNVMSVSLLRLRDGRVALFYLRKNSLTDCRPFVRFSSDEARTWSDPVGVIPDDQVGYYVLNNDRVVQLARGRLIAPLALHNRPGWKVPDWRGHILCYLSDDAGKTWRASKTSQTARSPKGARVTAQEPGVVELTDGRVMMWVRTDAGRQYQCFSRDGGDTWSALEPSGIVSPLSPASIERIPSTGDLLLVWNDHSRLAPSARRGRTPLTVAFSSDDGKTWRHVRDIEDDRRGWYCYTAIEFVGDRGLLAHVAGKQAAGRHLATTQITRFDVAWLYGRRR